MVTSNDQLLHFELAVRFMTVFVRMDPVNIQAKFEVTPTCVTALTIAIAVTCMGVLIAIFTCSLYYHN